MTVSDIDKRPQPDVENRLLPVIYVIEKGNPVISVTPGPSTSYILEGGCRIVERYRKLSTGGVLDIKGEGTVEDVDNPGEVIRLIAGDVIISEGGTKRRFSTNSRLKGKFARRILPIAY